MMKIVEVSMDDVLIHEETEAELKRFEKFTMNVFRNAGFSLNSEKRFSVQAKWIFSNMS